MTDQEKIEAIVKRTNINLDENMLAAIMTVSYLDELERLGIIEGGRYTVPEKGRVVVAICDEFEWAPTDKQISWALSGMVEIREEDIPILLGLIQSLRDNEV